MAARLTWSGKVLGGLLGGMVGGPLGVGVGAALGHLLADGETRARDLAVLRLEWRHHAFGAEGPGVRLTPVWLARAHAGQDVRVRLWAGDGPASQVIVVPDVDEETCALPEFFVPYAGFDGRVRVVLRSERAGPDDARFSVPLPSDVRRLGLSGPARLVMALVANARAGGRPLEQTDVRFVRETFTAGHPLDADGQLWLRTWLRTLRDAEPSRLAPDKVAARVTRHLQSVDDAEALVLWLLRGARAAWPGPAQQAWIVAFAGGLGLDAERVDALIDELEARAGEGELAAARIVLGVGREVDDAELRAAWLRLVQVHHPDRARTPEDAAEATARTARVNAAYRLLRG